MLPELSALRLLTEVARLGGIGAAGRAVGISQQSASERLRAMETQTGLALVRRAPRGSELTDAGRLLVEWSKDLLDRADEIDSALDTLRRGRARELRVHASLTTAEYLLPLWLVQFRRTHDVPVSLRAVNSDAVVAAVRAGESDLGFVEGPVGPGSPDTDGLTAVAVGTDELILVASPDDPWARRRTPVRPTHLAARALTCREMGSGTLAVVRRAMARAGRTLAEPEVKLATNAAILATVRAGGAPAFLSRRAAAADLELGTLAKVPVAGLELVREFRAVFVGGSHPVAGPVRDLLEIARHG